MTDSQMRRILQVLLVFLPIICASAGLMAEEPETTIKVDVKLVNVFVTVTDARGAPVANLQKENFVLKEDGKEQKIAIFSKESALPLSIALAVDTSLSTRKDLPLELISARKFAHAIVRPQDGLALYKFSEEVSLMVPFTSDLKKIDAGIERERNGAATALYDAIFLGSQALSRRQGRKVMVVITDGGDTMSQVNYKEALARGPGGGSDYLQHYHRAHRSGRGTRHGRRACADSDLNRYGRKVLLRQVARATGRRLPEDQRRTADAVSFGVLSVAAVFEFGIPSTEGGPDERARGRALSVALSGGVLHAQGDVLTGCGKSRMSIPSS